MSESLQVKIYRPKTKILRTNTTCNTPILLEEEPISEVESFKYLGSIMDKQRGAVKDVLTRIGKARANIPHGHKHLEVYRAYNNNKAYGFQLNVKTVLLYGCETWQTKRKNQQKIQTFVNRCEQYEQYSDSDG